MGTGRKSVANICDCNPQFYHSFPLKNHANSEVVTLPSLLKHIKMWREI